MWGSDACIYLVDWFVPGPTYLPTFMWSGHSQTQPNTQRETHPVPGLGQQLHVLLQVQRRVLPLVVRPVAEPEDRACVVGGVLVGKRLDAISW